MASTSNWRAAILRLLAPRAVVQDTPNDFPDRPAGPLIWLHVPHGDDRDLLVDVVSGMSDLMPDLWYLVTTEGIMHADLPMNCFQFALPVDEPEMATAFVNHWRPSCVAWINSALRGSYIDRAHELKIPVFVVQLRGHPLVRKFSSRSYKAWKDRARLCAGVLVSDERTSKDFKDAGLPQNKVELVAEFEPASSPPPCIEAERNTFANLLAARPVWLASTISPDEYLPVISAHQQALRRSHRLMLILHPAKADDGQHLAHLLNASGLTFAQRTLGEEPDTETQVYIADTSEEVGLWYRLASVCFVGGLAQGPDNCANPLDAASLGSAIIHGPHHGAHQKSFERLQHAHASVYIDDMDKLGNAVEMLLSPDKAAELAHAAWQVNSAGTEVTEHLINLLNTAFVKTGPAA